MRKIAIINQKGGVGKTTTTTNLGCAIAKLGKRVILIDLDPQAHLTMHLGIEPASDIPNIYNVFTGNAMLKDILKQVAENILVAPSTIDLAGAEIELSTTVGREVILRDAIEEYTDDYDFLFMDCPPSLGLLTINALCAADEVFITLQPHFLALQGMGKLLETIKLVSKRINHKLKVTGVILCMYDSGTKLANEVYEDLEQFFKGIADDSLPWSNAYVFKTRIRRNIKLAEAPSFGQDIFTYAPTSHGAEDYLALAKEILQYPEAKTVERENSEQVHLQQDQSEQNLDNNNNNINNINSETNENIDNLIIGVNTDIKLPSSDNNISCNKEITS